MREHRSAGLLLVGTLLLACGRGPNDPRSCPEGRTDVDGVCVREDVADFVACVRSQGARLDAQQSKRLSASAGVAATQGSVATDVSDRLDKQYSASDENVREIIRSCRALNEQHAADVANRNAPAGVFGAIAIADGTNLWGWVSDRPDRGTAERDATQLCGDPRCRPVAWFSRACGAIARAADGTIWYAAGQPSREEAEARALAECSQRKADCQSHIWACTQR